MTQVDLSLPQILTPRETWQESRAAACWKMRNFKDEQKGLVKQPPWKVTAREMEIFQINYTKKKNAWGVHGGQSEHNSLQLRRCLSAFLLSTTLKHVCLLKQTFKSQHFDKLGLQCRTRALRESALLKIKKGTVLHGCKRETRLLTKATNPTRT